jgi:hypothetical protein
MINVNVRALKQGLAKVQGLLRKNYYDAALDQLVDMLVRWPGNSQLHVLWATTVPLQESSAHTLDEAKQALRSAVLLDEHSPATAIELGHFLDAIEDNPQAASKAFSGAIGAAVVIDALLGQTRALLQLNKCEEAIACLVEALHLTNRRKPPHNLSGLISRKPTVRPSVCR